MSPRNAHRRLLLGFLLLQAFTLFTLAKPLTNPISLLNSATTSTALVSNRVSTSHNVTSLSSSSNIIDYTIVGTLLVLRITETGSVLSWVDVNKVIDKAIHSVVIIINAGHGKEVISGGNFRALTEVLQVIIKTLRNAKFTYFVLGDILAGIWQYMNEPWSGFREIVFDVLFKSDDGGWAYIGYGRVSTFKPDPPDPPAPEPSSSWSRNTDLALDKAK